MKKRYIIAIVALIAAACLIAGLVFVKKETSKYITKEITKQTLPDISNPDKLLFPEGKTLADMPMKKINTLSEYEDTQTQISDEIYRYINEIENTEITLENGNKVFVKKLMPNIKQYFSVNNTKDNNINSLQRFITDLRLLCKVINTLPKVLNAIVLSNIHTPTSEQILNSTIWDDIHYKISVLNFHIFQKCKEVKNTF